MAQWGLTFLLLSAFWQSATAVSSYDGSCLFAPSSLAATWSESLMTDNLPSYSLRYANDAGVFIDEKLSHSTFQTPLSGCVLHEITYYKYSSGVYTGGYTKYDNARKILIAPTSTTTDFSGEPNEFDVNDLGGLFYVASADDGYSRLYMHALPNERAVSLMNALMGQRVAVRVSMTCMSNNADGFEQETTSCMLFKAATKNKAPSMKTQTNLSVTYRFETPMAFPGFALPDAGSTETVYPSSIVNYDGSTTEATCNGDTVEFQGEDGEWYNKFLMTTGGYMSLNHIYYASERLLRVSTIQTTYVPTLQNTFTGRNIRMKITCANSSPAYTWLYFNAGGVTSFDCTADVNSVICPYVHVVTPAPVQALAPTPVPNPTPATPAPLPVAVATPSPTPSPTEAPVAPTPTPAPTHTQTEAGAGAGADGIVNEATDAPTTVAADQGTEAPTSLPNLDNIDLSIDGTGPTSAPAVDDLGADSLPTGNGTDNGNPTTPAVVVVDPTTGLTTPGAMDLTADGHVVTPPTPTPVTPPVAPTTPNTDPATDAIPADLFQYTLAPAPIPDPNSVATLPPVVVPPSVPASVPAPTTPVTSDAAGSSGSGDALSGGEGTEQTSGSGGGGDNAAKSTTLLWYILPVLAVSAVVLVAAALRERRSIRRNQMAVVAEGGMGFLDDDGYVLAPGQSPGPFNELSPPPEQQRRDFFV